MAENAPSSITGALRQRAEVVAATLPPLLIHAERVASTVAQGVHGRRRVGQGETFWQFRRYQPGDPANRIDWRRSAKSQRTFVRETEWEAAQSVWLWRDVSPSMNYRSSNQLDTKADRSTLLLLATATLLLRGGEHVALLGVDRVPHSGRAALHHLTAALGGKPGPLDSDGLPIPERLPRYAELVLFSDFLMPFERIEQTVKRFAAGGINGHLVQVLDPAEEDLPFSGRTRFEGLEREGDVTFGRAERLRGDYANRLAALREGLTSLTRRIGWTYSSHRTDVPPERPLLSLYVTLGNEAS
ncbi:MAG: DUF58 domain-containing protein [Alphaproteobacteria bacterium]|nr:DUF58 domain-containing protein [Alphaproteobacteria bacterium]